jgi:hypothetical protein
MRKTLLIVGVAIAMIVLGLILRMVAGLKGRCRHTSAARPYASARLVIHRGGAAGEHLVLRCDSLLPECDALPMLGAGFTLTQ